MAENGNPLEDINEIRNIINREGIPFRSAVKKKFEEAHWKCEVEYPYSLQKYIEEKGISKSIDIFARRMFPKHDNVALNFIIECKKSYALQNKWIFFKNKKGKLSSWEVYIPNGVFLNCFNQISSFDIFSCYDQIIIKPKEGKQQKKGEKLIQDIKRGDVTQIYQASSEVSNALFGIKSMFTDELSEVDPKIWTDFFGHIYNNNWFIPIVITNAELNICEFDISNTTLNDGKIEETKFKLETVPWLTFEYPLPYYLQMEDEEYQSNIPGTILACIRKLPIIFLNSMNIDEFLKNIYYAVAPKSYALGEIK